MIESKDGKARVLRADVLVEQSRGTAYTLKVEFATLTGEQADVLRDSLIEWFKQLEFRR